MTHKEFINIKEFSQFKNQNKLKLENIEEIELFFSSKYNKDFKPFYHLNPLYNTILNNNQFQYIIVDFEKNKDRVMICYKIIQIMKLKQIRIIGEPISLNNIEENINIIYKKLLNLSFIRIVTMNNNIFNGDKLVEYNDYFYDFNLRKFNGQFKSKNGINKMLSNTDFKVIVSNTVDKGYIEPLRKEWILQMEENGSKVSNQSTKDFYKVVGYKNLNNINIILTYKNSPISIQNFLINPNLKYADCLYINSDDIELQRVLKNLSDIQNYLAFTYLDEYGIKNVYVAGCRPQEKRLLKHKHNITDGFIEYYIK